MAQAAYIRSCIAVALARRAAVLVVRNYRAGVRRSYRGSNIAPNEELFPQRMTLPEDYGYVPMLSPSQVTAILQVYESTSAESAQGSGPVKSFDSNQLPSNSPIEDRRAVGNLKKTPGQLFSVIDGHGGAACAQAVSERLLDYIAISLLPTDALAEYSKEMRAEAAALELTDPNELPPDPSHNLVDYHRFRETYFSEDLSHIYTQSLQKYVVETLTLSDLDIDADTTKTVRDDLVNAFQQLDTDISVEAGPLDGVYDEDLLQIGLSGACACTVHLDGTHVHVANVGDCRAVLGSVDRETGAWKATPLSTDHNVDSESETKRVKSEHPANEYGNLFKNARLLGQLIPLRAFGDLRFKWGIKELKDLAATLSGRLGHSIIPAYYHTPPYLNAKPEVTTYNLHHNDRFIILASDGLWESMSNEKAVEIVGDHLVGMAMRHRFVRENYGTLSIGEINSVLRDRKKGMAYRTSDVNGATHLIRHALGYDHRKVSEMLTLPTGLSRFYRDDITVEIIYLDSAYLEKNCPPE